MAAYIAHKTNMMSSGRVATRRFRTVTYQFYKRYINLLLLGLNKIIVYIVSVNILKKKHFCADRAPTPEFIVLFTNFNILPIRKIVFNLSNIIIMANLALLEIK